MDMYKKTFLDNASKLDAVTKSCGEITKLATMIADEKSRTATLALLNKISQIVDGNEGNDIKRVARTLHTNLIEFYGHDTLHTMCYTNEEDEDLRSLDDLLHELHSLVGLEVVKSKVDDLIAFQRVQLLREKSGLHVTKNTMHLAFTGNPGTGKTTVARIIGRIYKQLGLLSKGHFIEVSRTDLIAGYQGQTALKVKAVIEKAKGGVLFIDEAYSITENEHSDSYGRECLTELTKALEDYRDDLVVIVAGYSLPMEKFFDANPGLKSRFNNFIEFPDYDAGELIQILTNICKSNDYVLEQKAIDKICSHINECLSQKEDNFANGRLMRNIYDSLVINHAKRVISLNNPSKEELALIRDVDYSY